MSAFKFRVYVYCGHYAKLRKFNIFDMLFIDKSYYFCPTCNHRWFANENEPLKCIIGTLSEDAYK